MSHPPRKLRWILFAAVALLSCLSIGFWLGLRDGPQTEPASADNSAAPARPVARSAPTADNSRPATANDNPDRPVPEASVEHRAEPESESPPAEEPRVPLLHPPGRLLFVTLDRKPAAAVSVVISYHRHRSPEVDHSLAVEAVTDQHGMVALDHVGRNATGMAISVKSEGWRIPPGSPFGELVDGWFITGAGAVVLERTRRVQVTAHYADGQLYDGQILIGRKSANGEEPLEMTRGSLDAILPADDPFWIRVDSRRPGFAATGGSYSREEPVPDRVEFVLAAEEPKLGVIEVDLTAFARADQLLVEVVATGFPWEPDFRARTSGGGVYVSPPRRPATYRVFVREDPNGALMKNQGRTPPETTRASLRAWRSQIVQVMAGETTRVTALAQQSSAVRARLVNESGQVLVPGIIFVEPDLPQPTVWERHHFRYKQPRPWSKSPYWLPGLTEEDGTAELPLVDPGVRLIGCEAPGYDITFVEVECLPGQTHDLGTVVLKPATGAIEIEIVNFDPNLSYTVKLIAIMGHDIRTGVILNRETGPKYRFEGLALRWYLVSVNNVERQVGAWSRGAKLSRDRQTARLQFEMHKPPLPPKVNQPDEN